MNNSILPRKSILVFVLFSVALVAWIPGQLKLSAFSKALAQSQGEKSELEQRIAEATAAVKTGREQLREQQLNRDKALASLKKAERELAKIDPEAQWVLPPADSPNWNPDSPYVWLRKDRLSDLPVEVFTAGGELRSEVATALVIDAAAQQSLKTNLNRLLTNYRALELASIEQIEKPLSDVGKDGTVVTICIKPLPEESAKLKEQLASALRDAVGRQRADLLKNRTDSWLYSQFSSCQNDPKTISVLRKPDGMYSVAYKSGYGMGNYGGDLASIGYNIAPHLLNYIVNALDEAQGEMAP